MQKKLQNDIIKVVVVQNWMYWCWLCFKHRDKMRLSNFQYLFLSVSRWRHLIAKRKSRGQISFRPCSGFKQRFCQRVVVYLVPLGVHYIRISVSLTQQDPKPFGVLNVLIALNRPFPKLLDAREARIESVTKTLSTQ